VALHRFFEGSDAVSSTPLHRRARHVEERRTVRTTLVSTATLACPRCDVPVALDGPRVDVTAPLRCPFCRHDGRVRDFLSLRAPTRPTRVEVHVVARGPR